MFTPYSTRNQKQTRNKRSHANIILSQVRNKLQIQKIDQQKKMNNSYRTFTRQIPNKTHQFSQTQTKALSKNTFNQTTKFQTPKESNFKMTPSESDSQSNIQPIQVKQKRRSSQLQIKLEEIIQYSKMYPTRNSARENTQKYLASYIQPKSSKSAKNSIYCEKKLKEEPKPRFSNFRTSTLKMPKQSKMSWKSNREKSKILNPDYFLQLVPNCKKADDSSSSNSENYDEQMDEKYCRDELRIRKKLDSVRIIRLLKESKKHCEENCKNNNFSLDTIIENKFQELKNKNGNSVKQKENQQQAEIQHKYSRIYFDKLMKKRLAFVRNKQELSLEDQKLSDFHDFIKGGLLIDEDKYDQYFSSREIQKYRENFDIYQTIYKKMTENLKSQKISPNQINQQKLKYAFYLNEQINKSHSVEAKRQIKEAMRRIKMLNLENNFQLNS